MVGPGPGRELLQGICTGHGIEISYSVGSRSEKSRDVVAWRVPSFPCCASGAVLGMKLGSGVSPFQLFFAWGRDQHEDLAVYRNRMALSSREDVQLMP